jgi:hypothetical protein
VNCPAESSRQDDATRSDGASQKPVILCLAPKRAP